MSDWTDPWREWCRVHPGEEPGGYHEDRYDPPNKWQDWEMLDDDRHRLRPTLPDEDIAVGPEWENIQRQRDGRASESRRHREGEHRGHFLRQEEVDDLILSMNSRANAVR